MSSPPPPPPVTLPPFVTFRIVTLPPLSRFPSGCSHAVPAVLQLGPGHRAQEIYWQEGSLRSGPRNCGQVKASYQRSHICGSGSDFRCRGLAALGWCPILVLSPCYLFAFQARSQRHSPDCDWLCTGDWKTRYVVVTSDVGST